MQNKTRRLGPTGFIGIFLIVIGVLMTVLTAPAEGTPGDKVTICHVPPGNPENAHTIEVNEHGLAGHLDNNGELHDQDYYGECEVEDPDEPEFWVCTPTSVYPTLVAGEQNLDYYLDNGGFVVADQETECWPDTEEPEPTNVTVCYNGSEHVVPDNDPYLEEILGQGGYLGECVEPELPEEPEWPEPEVPATNEPEFPVDLVQSCTSTSCTKTWTDSSGQRQSETISYGSDAVEEGL